MNSFKNNYLLWTGAGIFFCAFVVYFTILSINPSLFSPNNKFEEFPSVIALLIFTVIVGPFLEEIIFRGIFTERQGFKITFLLGALLYCLLTGNYYLISLVGLSALLIWKNRSNTTEFYIINALLFALVHYKIIYFHSFYDVIPIFFQFGFGLVLIWLVINFGLKLAVVFHMIYNAVLMGSFVFPLQFVDEKIITSKTDNLELNYGRTGIFGNSKISHYPNDVAAERVTIKQFAKLFEMDPQSIKIQDSLSWDRFNFRVKSKSNKKITAEEVKEILQKENLIEK